jgi:dTDP-4-dehydrorhamnose reductase
MHILLLGKNGQLGWELRRTLAPLGSLTALDFQELNLEDFDTVRRTIRTLKPNIIVNASAYTAVDRAESETEKSFAINAIIPGVLAEEALALKATLIHYSTDYVFDGNKGSPYTEEDAPNPLSVYGQSKLAGEQAIQAINGAYLIMRTSWVYSLRQGGFVNKVMEWARQQETLRIVSDQIANPTWARMLAEITTQILARGNKYASAHSGLYHLAGNGFTSRFEWTQKILLLDPAKHEHRVKAILPALTADFPTPAIRPLFSALDCSKFSSVFDLQLPDWELALALAQEK